MQIIIEYESSWRNSFLDGEDNTVKRNFIGSMTALGDKKANNYKARAITKNTVMGILNRLIGDQRKLYDARSRKDYYFKEIEETLNESDIKDIAVLDQEIIFLRNISGSTDQNAFTGMIKAQDKAFTSEFSSRLWGILFQDIDTVVQFILDENYRFPSFDEVLDPLIVINQLEELNALKPIELVDELQKAYEYIVQNFPDVDFKLTAKGLFTPVSFYTSALYIQISRLAQHYDLSEILTKSGGLSGISKRGFTKKDFMDRYTTGNKKIIWGNPYIKNDFLAGEGKVKNFLTKASGRLEITLHLSKDQAKDLEEKIENAGVSSFYLGKKGLAYVIDIR
ncbi:type I-Fv CRISPR-associated protein Cas5fv [Acinetobacter tibetensis]|uniref:Type I-Fv CRISPR-associated protein Cas5fv n=1 Tax=Acinetobacter tibetensis TaxID=2943497 RepID=A0AAE9RZH6_9GAMM|nr:type I-Fv CRISPR-associated protein Cas5fv [Acinetobacter tibetensis]USE82208.1 type I-Fv CRISPR-associated protein Cas5fv [Acinetobacter tibetensis]